MIDSQNDKGAGKKAGTDGSRQAPPALSLPKGGGAIRGLGEKFSANPVTGTGSLNVPVATSPGRSGFGPQLSLSYDSGAGNGPFGFGWSLSLPAITRKTDKGLPRYDDAAESDVFLLSGAEDLVPVTQPDDLTTDPGYRIRRYRPRIESLFARIERWTSLGDPADVHWRSITRDNVLTLYGKDANTRIADPADPTRIFSWLICETRDDKGNAVLYRYKAEDGVNLDLAQAHERNRGDADDVRRQTNRYIKRILYGNRTPLLDGEGRRPPFLTEPQIQSADWMFEVVFDYGEHNTDVPGPGDSGDWPRRDDPFSSYRAGFEVRTYRLCQRVLMFHHFPEEPEVRVDCLVRSTDFTYSHEQAPDPARDPVYAFLLSVAHSGYRRRGGGYASRSLPPLSFEYARPLVQDVVEEVDAASLENLPAGLNGGYQWTDLHGEGLPGILTEQGGAWFYKRNLSPINVQEHDGTVHLEARFAPVERVAARPNLTLGSGAQLMDLAGDGQPDLVVLDGPLPGLYEHDDAESWGPFRPFTARLSRDTRDPNLRFVDLDGDGHADVLITENDAFVWHPSRAEAGFGPAQRVAQALDEEKGPRLVFADGEEAVYLADLSGDGLTDLARIRNGEVCYWPNLGYGRFGAKVTMDNAPWFDNPDQFEQRRLRLADVDGSGTTDLLYLGRDGVRLYFNQSGNRWGGAQALDVFPHVDSLSDVTTIDLLGGGTACLVWSSPLPDDAGRPMRYVNLMGDEKPHLLVRMVNNLGAETRVHYAPSTKFYLQDKRSGRPWISRLPFPVHVVERVETFDHVSKSRFVSRYAYHHGYFDGAEREFRGFGLVEQFDTEALASLSAAGELPTGENVEAASHVPPVYTKTWFHTGVYRGRDHVSDFFTGLLDEHDDGEYYREPGLSDAQARALLLEDTVLPDGLTVEEEREACRALKGSMLRQEVYALDGTDKEPHPYTVTEQNFTLRVLQRRGGNRHAVFFTHPNEALTYHYERQPADPRIQHALTLEVDGYGNVLKAAAIGYGRRAADPTLPTDADRLKQTTALLTYTENDITNPVDDPRLFPADYRTPLPAETRTYELTGYTPTGVAGRYRREDFVEPDPADPARLAHIRDGETAYEAAPPAGRQRRLIERVRSLYRKDDLTALLPPGELEPLALPGESYKLAFTPGLLAQVYQIGAAPEENLLPDAAQVLGGKGGDQGGYVDLDANNHWWIPSGRLFFSTIADAADPATTAAAERAEARQHFFLPRKFTDPFDHSSTVDYDTHDLLVVRTEDAAKNTVTALHDYRVLQPRQVTDPNGDRAEVAFDALGMVVGAAVMGKASGPVEGDSFATFTADLTPAEIGEYFDATNPRPLAIEHLGTATTRIIYDLDRVPACAATIARETHVSDPVQDQQANVQLSFSCSDGFGREIQKKIQAEPGPVPQRDAGGKIIVDADGRPEMTANDVSPRWVGSGWTVFNNKGTPVRQYEPFFSDTHKLDTDVRIGVSPWLFYDPVERVVATLHPNRTYEKVVFDPWRQASYDVNDTVAADGTETGDPRTDADVKGYVAEYFETQPTTWQTWHQERITGAKGAQEKRAAEKAAKHANTPTTAHFDTLGRPFLTLAHNRFVRNGAVEEETYPTRVELDIEGNQRAVMDARDRIVMRYDYDLLGNVVHQASMEAGERWVLNDVMGHPIRAWDSRRFIRRMTYDVLRRPLGLFVSDNGAPEFLAEKTEYGEDKPDPKASNHRGKVWKMYDGAGIVTSEGYDFKGNLREGRRDLLPGYKQAVNWLLNPAANDGSFTSSTTYDALNRPLTVTTPDGSAYRSTFNEANLLDKVDVNLRGEQENGEPKWTPFVTNINYNAKGQRELIAYQNGAQTTYEYDPLTFRLIHLKTTRQTGVNPLQDLHYTYDPAGNITSIRDDAQQTIYFDNAVVEPHADYTYDALYRLIQGTGREHIGQTSNNLPEHHSEKKPHYDFNDSTRRNLPHPNDGQAMRRYTERYEYDAAGNILAMIHQANGGSWTRHYAYAAHSNRLLSTSLPGDPDDDPYSAKYEYDAHGNIIKMPHLPLMAWDYRDQLQATSKQVVNNGGTPETTYYVYDAAGQRVRKVTERQAAFGQMPTRMKERIYLGGFEIYREYENDGDTVALERETLQIMDDQQRIALVETRTLDTAGNDPAPQQIIRHQFGNHLGSASLELDNAGQIISYEEYHPYGSTSYQAGRSAAEVSLKRYRYTGKERDEETGFSYHGARYYAVWLGRWTSADPAGFADGLNVYRYARDCPVTFTDSRGTDSEKTPPMVTMLPEEMGDWRSADFSAITEEGPFTLQTISSRTEYDQFGRETGYNIISERTITGVARRTRHRGWSYEGLSDAKSVTKVWSDIERPPSPKPDFTVDLSEPKAHTKRISTGSSATRAYRPVKSQTKGAFSRALDWVQGGLDLLSLGLDATGIGALVSWIPDVLNAVISLGRGDWVGAGLSTAATIPFLGAAANTTRLARAAKKAGKVADDIVDDGGTGVRYFLHGAPTSALDDIVKNGVKPVSTTTNRFPKGSFFTIEAVPKPGLFGGVAGAIEAQVGASHMAYRHGGNLGVLVGELPASVIKRMGKNVEENPLLHFGKETVFKPKAIKDLNDNAKWFQIGVRF